jgi:hypothetical protein
MRNAANKLNTIPLDLDDGVAPTKATPFGTPPFSTGDRSPGVEMILDRIATALERIADQLAPLPSDIVGSGYVAKRLGCTTVWVAEMARRGDIPKSCLVPGTGNGKLWRFYRQKIDRWLATR